MRLYYPLMPIFPVLLLLMNKNENTAEARFCYSYGNKIHKAGKKLFIIDFQEDIALGSGFFTFIFNFFHKIFKNGIFFCC